jgi:hypothetical protein
MPSRVYADIRRKAMPCKSKRTRTYLNGTCASLCAVLIALSGSAPLRAQDSTSRILFIQQDKVITFVVNQAAGTGSGIEAGTATGYIKGTTLTNFAFTFTSPTTFTFDDHVGITDIDGDQIIFDNVGTGRFIFPGLVDPTPGVGQVLNSTAGPLGGPLTGTYKVVATSGKYVRNFPIGLVLQYRAIAMNPNSPGAVGSTYVEVYAPNFFFRFLDPPAARE